MSDAEQPSIPPCLIRLAIEFTIEGYISENKKARVAGKLIPEKEAIIDGLQRRTDR